MSAAVPAPVDSVEPAINGTHRVEPVASPGGSRDRVVIRDVEIFSEVTTGDMGEVDAQRVDEIARRTNDRMAQGQHPLIIVSHDDDPSAAPVVGRIPGPVRAGQLSNGLRGIYADFEMARSDFDALIASNKMPRRSVEIDREDEVILQVALLGREAPGARIPDMHFFDAAQQGCDRLVLMRSGNPPASVTFADSQPQQEAADMTAEEINQLLASMDPEELRRKLAEMLASAQSDKNEPSDSADGEALTGGDDDEDEEDMAESGDNRRTANSSSESEAAKYASEVRRLKSQVGVLSTKLEQTTAEYREMAVRAKYAGVLHDLATVEGFSTVDPDAEMDQLVKFGSDAERDAHIDHIRANYRRDTGVSLVNASRMGGAAFAASPKTSNDLSMSQAEKIADYAAKHGITSFDEAADKMGIALGATGNGSKA